MRPARNFCRAATRSRGRNRLPTCSARNGGSVRSSMAVEPSPACATNLVRVRVAVVGAGVVGLATAACLVRDGVEVVCFERSAAVMGERSAGSSRIFRLAHVDADLVRLAEAARRGFARWGAGIVDPVGCVVSGGDAAERAAGHGGGGRAPRAAGHRGRPGSARGGPGHGAGAGRPVGRRRRRRRGADAARRARGAHRRARGGRGHRGRCCGRRRRSRPGGRRDARFDAVVLAAGAGTAALAAEVGIDLPSALQHHARFTFPLPGGPRPAWIDAPPAGLRTYQHRSGPGRWSVGGTVDAAAVAWDVGPDAATGRRARSCSGTRGSG